MEAADLVDRLAQHKTLGAAPREELAWLAAHGSLRHMNAGEVLTAKGAAARIGVEWATFRKYMQRGRTPDMDVLIDGEPKGWLCGELSAASPTYLVTQPCAVRDAT